MRLQKPQFPSAKTGDQFGADLVFKVKQFAGQIIDQLNGISEGSVSAVTNAYTAPPISGTYQVGDFVRNSAPAVHGTAGAHYIVTGWTCVTAGTPGTWVETRSLTGT